MSSTPGSLVLIANPHATRFTTEMVETMAAACEAHGPVRVVAASGLERTVEAAREARADNTAVVAVAGGDGTVAEVAGVLADSDTALLPIPAGSTNVFARGLGWPARAADMPPLIAAGCAPDRRTLRLGTVQLDDSPPRVFCINTGMGIDSATVEWVEAHPKAKHRFRQMAFAGAAAGPGLLAFVGRPRLEVSVDGTAPVPASSFLAGCGRPYAYVGARPLDLLPRANWDGYIEWLALARAAPMSASHLAMRVLAQRDHLAGSALVGGMSADRIELIARRSTTVQADGEALGSATRVVIRPGPQLKVVVPVGMGDPVCHTSQDGSGSGR